MGINCWVELRVSKFDSLYCIRVKGGENEQFRIDIGVYHVPLAFQCIYGCSDEGGEDKDGKEGIEIPGGWKSVDFLASCMQMNWFCVVSWRRT